VRVLVTGGAGYIGSILVRHLIDKGYGVTVLDALFFGEASLRDLAGARGFTLLRGDIRNSQDISTALRDADAVVHLAALVGEPAATKWPDLNRQINIDGTRNLLRQLGGRLLVYSSSCSVYGNQEGTVNEESPVMALGPYAESRIEGERMIREMTPEFVIFRFATVFGLSPRMRFDLLVNEFTLAGWSEGLISIYNPEIVRPFVHIQDIARGVTLALEEPKALGQTINLGLANLSKTQLASAVADITGARVAETTAGTDVRNYTVSFEKVGRILGFTPDLSVEQGAREVLDGLRCGDFPDPSDPVYYNHSPVYFTE